LEALDPVAKVVAPKLGWGINRTRVAVGSVMGVIPGMFGFLVWELKENWRLYRANQSRTLDPVMVGSHGERVINLIRPGFHSGTLPRLFARLRHAEGARARKAIEQLHHVEEAVRRFVERELLQPLAASQGWGVTATVAIGDVRLASNRVRVELCCPALDAESALLDLENYDGTLLAGFARTGWLTQVEGENRRTLEDLLAGFYKLAGVRLLRAPNTPSPPSVPESGRKRAEREPPFARAVVRWDDWVAMWERDQAGQGHTPPLLSGFELLP
jgi:hypothetical protein